MKLTKFVGIVGGLGVLGGSIFGVRQYLAYRRLHEMLTVYAWRLPSGAIFVSEDPSDVRLQKYRQLEHLDQVIKPYTNDLDQIMALARWTSQQFKATTPFPNYPPWDGEVILDHIRRGICGGFCAQYAFVFGQACQTAGYYSRFLDLASPENGQGHFTTEVYVPSLKKWIVVESEWGYYYKDSKGNALSALELHDWAIGKRTDPLYKAPSMERVDPSWPRLFYYFRYYLRNNYLTVPVFLRRIGDQMGFEPYRLAWQDAYTGDTLHLQDSLTSADRADFEYQINDKSIPDITWQKRGDFYAAISSLPLYHVCKIHLPRFALLRIIKADFVHNPDYHRLGG